MLAIASTPLYVHKERKLNIIKLVRKACGIGMNKYTLSELCSGMEESFCVVLTENMLQKFLEISGDTNPLHIDAEFARTKGYPDRVVYGMVTASFYSTLAGVYLPGKHCLLWEVNSKFNAPVFIGDELNISGTITKVNKEFNFVKIKAKIRNQRGQIVSRASITAGVTE